MLKKLDELQTISVWKVGDKVFESKREAIEELAKEELRSGIIGVSTGDFNHFGNVIIRNVGYLKQLFTTDSALSELVGDEDA